MYYEAFFVNETPLARHWLTIGHIRIIQRICFECTETKTKGAHPKYTRPLFTFEMRTQQFLPRLKSKRGHDAENWQIVAFRIQIMHSEI